MRGSIRDRRVSLESGIQPPIGRCDHDPLPLHIPARVKPLPGQPATECFMASG